MQLVFEPQDIIGGQDQVQLMAAFVKAGDLGMAGKTEFFVFSQGDAVFGEVMVVHIFGIGDCVLTGKGLSIRHPVGVDPRVYPSTAAFRANTGGRPYGNLSSFR
ncbi:MAG: hypothetical protein D3909_15605 [Candidatus Electrothrix sp. ATG1]|nr:hypothetical protein [Candidatus Electrothrix sp. ATG1]